MQWLCAWFMLSCASPAALPVIPVTIGAHTYQLEVATTEAARETGLMHRDTIGAQDGMIFLFPTPAPRSFWMKNTRTPLDIIFLSPKNRVMKIMHGEPYSLRPMTTDAVGGNVIELDAGRAAREGIRPNDVVRYELPSTVIVR